MMKKILLTTILCASISFWGNLKAQVADSVSTSVKSLPVQPVGMFGYVNSNELLELIPGKIEASAAIKKLTQEYKTELTKMQNEYNAKYSDFMKSQNLMSENIKLRRMQELHELEQKINEFLKVSQGDIDAQEQQLINPLRQKLKDAINTVGVEQNLICIYDLSNPSIVFITPKAIDITPFVKAKLGIK